MFKKIKFARTPCYGTCPVFDVEVDQDGIVEWNGHMHVYCLGEENFTITKNKIEKLNTLIEEFGFRSFKYPEPESLTFATDHPSCFIQVEYEDGFVKEIEHYLGDIQTMVLLDEKLTLDNLVKFENRLEQILGLRKYINPTFYIYHLKIESEEYVVCAPNEKDALKLVGYTGEISQFKIQKIGRDTTTTVIPYVVMDK